MADDVLDPTVIQSLHELGELSPSGPEQLRGLVEVFVRDGRERLDRIRVAADTDDRPTLAAVAHSLAGSAGSLGAVRLAAMCRDLEAAAAPDSPDAVTVEIDAMDAAFGEAVEALRAAFGTDEDGLAGTRTDEDS